MRRVQGTAGVSPIECINADLNKWNVRWDIRNNPGTEEGRATGINYMEETFLFEPTVEDVQQIISFWCGSGEQAARFVLEGKTVEVNEQGLSFLRDRTKQADKDGEEAVFLSTLDGVVVVTPQEALFIVEELTRYMSAHVKATLRKLEEIEQAGSIEVLTAINFSEGYPEAVSMTLDEIGEAIARRKPTTEQQAVMFARMAINTVDLGDNEALSVKDLHPAWETFIGKELKAKSRVTYRDGLYRVRQDINPVLENQPPCRDTAALYEEINEEHAGTADDPIPYNNNMELFAGKYYSQGGTVYECVRDTGQAVYQDLEELVRVYVEEV